MKITFLGTAASEGFPSLFCQCDHCARARAAGGRNIRSRFSIDIDGTHKIDFPPDTGHHFFRDGLDLSRLQYLFVSHQHGDHFHAFDLTMHDGCFAHRPGAGRLALLGNRFVAEEARRTVEGKHGSKHSFDFQALTALETVEAGPYLVTALPADHMRPEDDEPFFYLFEERETGRCALLAHDTGYFPKEAWEFLKGKRLHLLSLDCTHIIDEQRSNHMGISTNLEVRRRLLEDGAITKNTPVYLNHFSHNGGLIHDELLPIAEKEGLLVAFDGLSVDI